MTDPVETWRVAAASAIVVLVVAAGLFRVFALTRASMSLLAILRREHTRRRFGPDDFPGRWSWRLYTSSTWLMLAAGLLVLLLVATRALA